VPVDDEPQADLDDGVVGRAGVRVREGVPRLGEKLEQLAVGGEVDAAQLRGERLDLHALRRLRGRRRHHIRDGRVGMDEVFQKTCVRSRGDRRDDRPHRRSRVGLQLRRDLLRLRPREMEEPRQDLGEVLAREDVRQLGDARQAQPPVADRIDDLGELPHQLRRPVAVERGALREPEIAHEEVEQRVVPEVDPALVRVERRERDEKVREGDVLTAKEIGENVGELACGAHEAILSRDLAASVNARGSLLARERDGASPNRQEGASAPTAGAGASRAHATRDAIRGSAILAETWQVLRRVATSRRNE
jgi:hypothetical protein